MRRRWRILAACLLASLAAAGCTSPGRSDNRMERGGFYGGVGGGWTP